MEELSETEFKKVVFEKLKEHIEELNIYELIILFNTSSKIPNITEVSISVYEGFRDELLKFDRLDRED